jgi:hypothetical protein
MTHHEAVEAAAAVGSPRLPLSNGMSQIDEMQPNQLRGTLVPKKSTQAMDPTAGGKANRQNLMYEERHGAAYTISVPFTPTIDPSAGPTMANARIIPSVAGRTPNFGSGAQAASESSCRSLVLASRTPTNFTALCKQTTTLVLKAELLTRRATAHRKKVLVTTVTVVLPSQASNS